jgi:tetratricopeptide (TPR) repeat protein
MPSHIFTRLGLWDESINANLNSVSSARCYAEQTGINGHWDEELHSLDYLAYAYLQKGDNSRANEQWNYLKTMRTVSPMNFKVAYTFAAIPSRYLLENKRWEEAASLEVTPAGFDWKDYPWQNAIIHFTRGLGAVHTDRLQDAKTELNVLKGIQKNLLDQKDAYKANQVLIQIKAVDGWIRFREGKNDEALELMREAAEMEDATQKHPVTPGEVLPARELLADLLLAMNQPAEAFRAYEEDLKKHPNRLNGLYGAAVAAERSKQPGKARYYYDQLSRLTGSDRIEIEKARQYIKQARVKS